MFTGLIEAMGVVAATEAQAGGGLRLSVRSDLEVGVGDSVAHSGVCLTVVEVTSETFAVDVGPETLDRTTMGRLGAGDALNLERALLPTTRMGGHLVQGHVDAVGEIRSIAARDNAYDLWIDAPAEVLRLVIPRGSVAVDGISLTVTGRDEAGFSICIIPHTWTVTTLGQAGVGQGVNLEADLMARYIADLLGERRG
jgi:riboflavin synthase